jgi:HSP20 family protein
MFGRTLFDELNEIRRSFDQLFENSLAGSSRRPTGTAEWSFAPAVETGWTDEFLNLRVVLPGVTQENLKMTVQGNQLAIQGERKAPADFGKEGMVYNQIVYGKFERTLELPTGLDLDKLQAHLHDGLLDIRIPIAAAVKPRQVPITAGAAESHQKIAA